MKPKRDHILQMLVTEQEYEITRRAAFEARMTISSFLRKRVFLPALPGFLLSSASEISEEESSSSDTPAREQQ
jgi:hypothetical protein